jgi:hypothetical protein
VLSPDGTTHEFVAHVGYGVGGRAIFWEKGKHTHDPVITVYAIGRQVHQESSRSQGCGAHHQQP